MPYRTVTQVPVATLASLGARDFARGLPKNPVILPPLPHMVRNCIAPTALVHGRLWSGCGSSPGYLTGWDGKGWIWSAVSNHGRRLGPWEAFKADGTRTWLQQTYTGTNTYVEVATDPVAAWADALSITDLGATYASYKNSIVYLGGGKVLFLQYCEGTVAKRIYFSADGGVSWGANAGAWNDGLPILQVSANKCIRHFHGAVYDSVTGKLYVLVGDAADEACILVCDNLDPDDAGSLMRAPDTWKERWALRDVDHGARAAQLAANPDYSLAYDGSRVGAGVCSVDLVFRGDYAYYAMDQNTLQNYIHRVHRTSGAVTRLGAVTGTGWYGCATADGHLLVTAASSRSGGAYSGTSDEYVRLYAVLSDDSTVVLLRKWLRGDAAAPGSGVSVNPYRVTEFLGHVWIYFIAPGSAGIFTPYVYSDVFRVVDVSAAGLAPAADDLLTAPEDVLGGFNWVSNPRFVSATTGWSVSNCAIARDTGVLDTEAGTYVASLKITPTDDNPAYIQQGYNTGPENNMVGRWFTFACRIKLPSGRPGGTQKVLISTSGGGASMGSFPGSVDADWDGGWHEYAMTFFCKPSDPTLSITIWAHYGAAGGGGTHQPIYVSDVRVAAGARPGAMNAPCIDML